MSNDFLRILGMNQAVFLSMIICGSFLIVTASVGVSAAYSKNECLAFVVSPKIIYKAIVRFPRNEYYAYLYSSSNSPLHPQK
jgi:hypothetical protein